jgi:hypothetical protein
MQAALRCLLVVLMRTSAGLARPLRWVASAPSCPSGQQVMPDLTGLTLRSSPRVGLRAARSRASTVRYADWASHLRGVLHGL